MQYIVFLDPDPQSRTYVPPLRRLLQRSVTVRRFSDTDKAWKFLQKNSPDIVGCVMEVMLAPGSTFRKRKSVQGGMRTGVVLFKGIRRKLDLSVPVVFLSWITTFKGLGIPRRLDNYRTYRKSNCPPETFAQEACEFFAQQHNV